MENNKATCTLRAFSSKAPATLAERKKQGFSFFKHFLSMSFSCKSHLLASHIKHRFYRAIA